MKRPMSSGIGQQQQPMADTRRTRVSSGRYEPIVNPTEGNAAPTGPKTSSKRPTSCRIETTSMSSICDEGERLMENISLDQKHHIDNLPASNRINNPRFWELVLLTCFNFPYGLICGTMGLFILPYEAIRLFPKIPSITLGLSLLIVGVSQLICPLAGRLSDSLQTTTVYGKRKPFLVVGTLVGASSVLGMWFASAFMLSYLYYLLLLVGMLALNVIYSVQCGLVPDFMTDSVTGMSSGIVAVHGLVGASVGFASMIATTKYDYHLVYPAYAFLVSASSVLSMIAAVRLQNQMTANSKERALFTSHSRTKAGIFPRPTSTSVLSADLAVLQEAKYSTTAAVAGGPLARTDTVRSAIGPETVDACPPGPLGIDRAIAVNGNSPNTRIPSGSGDFFIQTEIDGELQSKHLQRLPFKITAGDIIDAYTIDTSTSYDFFWVFMGRTFYYIGVSVQAFIMFYLRDVVGTKNEAQRRIQIGSIALVAQSCAAAVAYPVGKLSDDVRVGKKRLIYVACASMSLVYIGFLIAPLFGPWAFAWVLSTSVVYGAGNGCFLAVDYGLALETLPDKSKTAQALGIWGVAAFIGSAAGPLAWGSLIQFFGGQSGSLGFGALMGVDATGAAPSGAASAGGGVPRPEGPTAEYGYAGYEAMLLGGIIATISAGLIVTLVKKGSGLPTDNMLSTVTAAAASHVLAVKTSSDRSGDGDGFNFATAGSEHDLMILGAVPQGALHEVIMQCPSVEGELNGCKEDSAPRVLDQSTTISSRRKGEEGSPFAPLPSTALPSHSR